MRDFPIFLSGLTEDDRRHIKHCLTKLLSWLHRCKTRLRGYEAEDAEGKHQSVLKLLQELKETRVMIDEMMNELIEKHRLPADLKQIDEETRQAFRKVLIGLPLE